MNCHGEGNEEDLLVYLTKRKIKNLFFPCYFRGKSFYNKTTLMLQEKLKLGGML